MGEYGYEQPGDVSYQDGRTSPGESYSYDQPLVDKQKYNYLSHQQTFIKKSVHGLPTTFPPNGQTTASFGHNNAIVKQPVSSTVVFAQPPTYMGLSIITCLCCFWPLGIAATLYSLGSSNAADRMDFTKAKSDGRMAKRLSIASVVCGITMYITLGLLVHRYVTLNP